MQPSSTSSTSSGLLEVWGDTVNGRHLLYAIVLGIGISLGAYLVAKSLLLEWVADAVMAKSYAMLAGLAGCIISGVVCAIAFAPEREVVEGSAIDTSEREHTLALMTEEIGGLGSLEDVPEASIREMQELEILSLFSDKPDNRQR